MAGVSAWQTWKPYAGIAALAVGGFWWFNTQSFAAALKDGSYDCQAVYVNASGKYEVVTDSSGSPMYGSAYVSGGRVTEISGDSSLGSSQVASLTVRSKGTSQFQATDDPAMHSYYAIACDFAG